VDEIESVRPKGEALIEIIELSKISMSAFDLVSTIMNSHIYDDISLGQGREIMVQSFPNPRPSSVMVSHR